MVKNRVVFEGIFIRQIIILRELAIINFIMI